MSNCFKIKDCDKYMYVKIIQIGYIMVYLYVDNILIIGSNDTIIKTIKIILTSKFEIKGLG